MLHCYLQKMYLYLVSDWVNLTNCYLVWSWMKYVNPSRNANHVCSSRKQNHLKIEQWLLLLAENMILQVNVLLICSIRSWRFVLLCCCKNIIFITQQFKFSCSRIFKLSRVVQCCFHDFIIDLKFSNFPIDSLSFIFYFIGWFGNFFVLDEF